MTSFGEGELGLLPSARSSGGRRMDTDNRLILYTLAVIVALLLYAWFSAWVGPREDFLLEVADCHQVVTGTAEEVAADWQRCAEEVAAFHRAN